MNPQLAEDAIASLDTSSAGRALQLQLAEKRATTACTAEPPLDLFTFTPPSQFTPAVRRITGSSSYDLYLYVYPQAVAGRLGGRWINRVKGQEYVVVSAGPLDEVLNPSSFAVFLGTDEYNDPKRLRWMVSKGLGLSGPVNELRPNVDGECTDPGNPGCGPDIP